MKNSVLRRQQLFVCYLQELYDTKSQQVEYYTHETESNFSGRFIHFLIEQQANTLEQYTALESLTNTLNVHLSSEAYSPVRNLFRDAKQVSQHADENRDFNVIESTLAQLLQEVKRHEMTVGQGALTIACKLQEVQVAGVFSKILDEDEQAYLQLRNFKVSSKQNESITTDTNVW